MVIPTGHYTTKRLEAESTLLPIEYRIATAIVVQWFRRSLGKQMPSLHQVFASSVRPQSNLSIAWDLSYGPYSGGWFDSQLETLPSLILPIVTNLGFGFGSHYTFVGRWMHIPPRLEIDLTLRDGRLAGSQS